MNLSERSSLCTFCKIGKAIYKCPKCCANYCSLICFKHPNHNSCSELFYKECVFNALRGSKASVTDKDKMVEILRKAAADDEGTSDKNQPSIETRFMDLNLSNDIDEKILWERLTLEEQESFKNMLSHKEEIADIIPIKHPWWVSGKVTFIQNNDDDSHEKHLIAERPSLPVGIKTLRELTSKPPSDTVQYSVLNVLYSYTYLIKFYHNELRDFIEDVVDSFFCLCPVFTENKNYFSLDEAIQDSVRLLSSVPFELDISFAKSLIHDVCCIINGPANAKPHLYVVCALNDIKMLMLNFKTISRKSKHLLLCAVKKLEYFMSWSVDFYERNLKCLLEEIELKYIPEIASDVFNNHHTKKSESHFKTVLENSKVLIKELD